MIKLYNLLPKVYYNRSRDFQILGRLYEIMFNYIKNNVDMISYQPLNSNGDNRFLDLLCSTLGLKLEHQYDNEQLCALCGIFISSLRNKGNLKSIKQVLNLLISLEGCSEETYLEQGIDGTLYIYVPQEITDLLLFKDVLEYIIPTGLNYRIINQSITIQKATTELTNTDSLAVKIIDNSKLIMITKLDSSENQIISDLDSDKGINENLEDGKIKDNKLSDHEGFIPSGIDSLSLITDNK